MIWAWHKGRKKWAPIKPRMDERGRLTVHLRIRGKQTSRSVPGLVLRAWVGPRPLGFEAFRFPDLDPHNNCVENLRWARKGAHRTGVPIESARPFVQGEANPNAKLDPEKVRLARRLYLGGVSTSEIAERFGLHRTTIQLVIQGKRWGHITNPGPVPLSNGTRLSVDASPRNRLDQEAAEEIRSLFVSGISRHELAARFGVSHSMISRIIRNKCWKI